MNLNPVLAPTPIVDRKIRFALVGCGRISKNHFEALAQHQEEAEWVAVCDIDPIALERGVTHTGAQGFTALHQLLQYSEAEVVVLTTPSGLHPRQAIECAQAGRHVVSEKPMATQFEWGQRMVQACRDAGVKLFVVKQNRLNPTVQKVKQALQQGRFGRVHLCAINVFWTRPQSYYDAAPWRGRWDLDGGAFMNQASHYVDLLDWLVGPVDSVHAYTATLARDIEAEDCGVMNVRLRHGGLGSVNVTMLTYPCNLEGSVTVLGERGTVKIGGTALNRIEHWEFETPISEDEHAMDTSYGIQSVYGPGHPLYYDNVIKTLRGQAQAQVDGYEGLRSLEILVAAYRSARDGVRVGLPLVF
jgi:UDP-N-acetyl-2-amino-2-deoxyglucuronate dehydrogenase